MEACAAHMLAADEIRRPVLDDVEVRHGRSVDFGALTRRCKAPVDDFMECDAYSGFRFGVARETGEISTKRGRRLLRESDLRPRFVGISPVLARFGRENRLSRFHALHRSENGSKDVASKEEACNRVKVNSRPSRVTGRFRSRNLTLALR